MKNSLLILLIISLFIKASHAQEIETPRDYVLLEEKNGDLDNDSVDEKVRVYNINKGGDEVNGKDRDIIIYKNQNGNWIVWRSSQHAILNSSEGGMMGDPFDGIEIINGILLVRHFGGSSWKWTHTDKYRFQNNEFHLIGYSSLYGKPCEYWINVDFNLSTGKIIYKKEYEECESEEPQVYKTEEETFYEKGILLTLSDRNLKEITIISPKYKYEVYL